jgi:hypothetical protein
MIQRGKLKNVCWYVNDHVMWYCYNRTHTKTLFISLCAQCCLRHIAILTDQQVILAT